MLRRSLTAAVFLLLVWAQTLAAACDARCSLPSHCGATSQAAPSAAMEHCGAMSHGDEQAHVVTVRTTQVRCHLGHQLDAVWPPVQPEGVGVLAVESNVGPDADALTLPGGLPGRRTIAAFALPPPWAYPTDPRVSSVLNSRV